MFYSYRNINLKLNGNIIPVNDLQLSQDVDIKNPIQENNRTSITNLAVSPLKGSLQIRYYLTGNDPIKNYIFANENFPLSGNIGEIYFTKGHLSQYSVSMTPDAPIEVGAVIDIFDEISGTFISQPAIIPNVGVFNSSKIAINQDTSYSKEIFGGIGNATWNYRANLVPVYTSYSTGIKSLTADRIAIKDKTISLDFTCDSVNPSLSFTGQRYAVDFICYHPTNSNYFETYSVSGRINKKSFSVSSNNVNKTLISIQQSHLGNLPTISNVSQLVNGYTTGLRIASPSFFSSDNNVNFVEKITVGGIQFPFITGLHGGIDALYAQVPPNAINGILKIDTTKGSIIYPNPITLLYPPIVISGFSSNTGSVHSLITVSGLNFNTIDSVYLNNTKCSFQLQTTGNTHSILLSIPTNPSVGKITLISSLRNINASSIDTFLPQPEIINFLPVTGTFGSTITISGKNFSGISGILFNGVSSPSFSVVNQNKITCQTPGVGSGYAKGYITILGTGGMQTRSFEIYKPIIPIFSLSSPSGQIGDTIQINTVVDTGYFYPLGISGYKVSFGTNTGIFYVSGGNSTGTLTGLIPQGYFQNNYIYIYEPDGGTYPVFSGKFQQIGPAPVVSGVFPTLMYQYKFYNMSFVGVNFKDFFGLPYYFMISGRGYSGLYPSLSYNSNHTKAIITGIRTTGAPGNYTYVFRNFAGATSGLNQIVIQPAIDEARRSRPGHLPNASIDFPKQHPPGNAIDGSSGSLTFSATSSFTTTGLWYTVFPESIDISLIYISQSGMPATKRVGTSTWSLVPSGGILLYDSGDILVTGFSGAFDFTGNFLNAPITGIKKIRIYSSGDKPDGSKYFGFSTVSVY